MASVLFCVLDYHPEPAGGAERQARLQAEELARRGHRVTVVCRGIAGARSGPVGPVQVDRLRSGRAWPWRLLHYPRLAWYLARRGRDHDVIHVHHANLQADVAVAVGRLLGRPVYLKLAGGGRSGEIARWRWLRRWTGHASFRWADAVQAQTTEMVDDLLAIGVRPGRIVRIPNGVAAGIAQESGPSSRIDARERMGLPPDVTVVLWLGRFDEAKGFADVLEAWRPLRADPRLALLLVGRPAGLRPVTPDAGDNVHVVPWLADPNDALLAADVFVLPSHGEGMANALLEALASGLPVISTPVGAGASLVGASGAGLIVPVGDVAALRAALVELTDAGADRATMAAAARAAVADLTIDRVVDRVEAVYRELLRTDRGPVAPDAEHGTMGSDTTSVRTRASRE